MILKNQGWKKPQRICFDSLFIGEWYTQEEVMHKFKLFMDKWYGKDGYYVCCKPFKRSDGKWCIYSDKQICVLYR